MKSRTAAVAPFAPFLVGYRAADYGLLVDGVVLTERSVGR